MSQFLNPINPYDILEISPTASNKEITVAFTMAIKRRKYSPKDIAQARKSLMNSQTRIVADYLRPIVSPIENFETSDFSILERPIENLEFLADFDNLKSEIDSIDSISNTDRELGQSLLKSIDNKYNDRTK